MKTVFILIIFSIALSSDAQNKVASTSSMPDSNGVYAFVEQMPEYPGRDAALMGFLQKNLKWPNIDSTEDNLYGKISVRLTIDTDGSITNIIWLRPQSPSIKKEVTRVLNFLPRFRPGIHNGKAVKVYFNLPITICFR